MATLAACISALLLLLLCTVIWNRKARARLSAATRLDSPHRISAIRIVGLYMRVICKHILASCGLAPRLRPHRSHPQAFDLPLLYYKGSLDVNGHDQKQLSRALNQKDTVAPGTVANPLFLVALTSSAAVRILTDSRCPILPLGAVNTRNTFCFWNSAFCRSVESIIDAARSGQLHYRASFGDGKDNGKRTKRGIAFYITVDVLNADEKVLSQRLHYLQFLPRSAQPLYQPATGMAQIPEPSVDSDSHVGSSGSLINMDEGLPWKWAAVCKDYNAIHISRTAARIFGFKNIIAHGNHVVALALQSLLEPSHQQSHPAGIARSMSWETAHRLWLEVRFMKPILLPSACGVQWYRSSNDTGSDQSSVSFSVVDQDAIYITGRCSFEPVGESTMPVT